MLTAFAAKGLEFHCVILPMFEEGNYPLPFAGGDEEKRRQFELRMRNLLYVAMTRARTLLTITWSGANGSRFLQEMDPALYRLEGLPPDLSGFSEMENNIERRSDLRLKTMGGAANRHVKLVETQDSKPWIPEEKCAWVLFSIIVSQSQTVCRYRTPACILKHT